VIHDYRSFEDRFREQLHLSRRPVAVAFRSAPPEGVPAFSGSVPSGCSFWRLASEGRSFSTIAGDHFNCPIGSYTHNVSVPAERSAELEDVLKLMNGIGYIRMEEIPSVFRLAEAPQAVVYAPLGETPVDPDVVLFAGPPGNLMLLIEAAFRAGVASGLPLLARPTCMALPAALATGVVTSAGCIGNRIYTDVGEDQLYTVVPGRQLKAVADALETIVKANAGLAEYHRARRSELLVVT